MEIKSKSADKKSSEHDERVDLQRGHGKISAREIRDAIVNAVKARIGHNENEPGDHEVFNIIGTVVLFERAHNNVIAAAANHSARASAAAFLCQRRDLRRVLGQETLLRFVVVVHAQRVRPIVLENEIGERGCALVEFIHNNNVVVDLIDRARRVIVLHGLDETHELFVVALVDEVEREIVVDLALDALALNTRAVGDRAEKAAVVVHSSLEAVDAAKSCLPEQVLVNYFGRTSFEIKRIY